MFEKKTVCHCSINFSPQTLLTAKTTVMEKEIKLHEVQSRKKKEKIFNLSWLDKTASYPFFIIFPNKKKRKKKCLTIYQGIWLPFFLLPTIYVKKKTLQTFHCLLQKSFGLCLSLFKATSVCPIENSWKFCLQHRFLNSNIQQEFPISHCTFWTHHHFHK